MVRHDVCPCPPWCCQVPWRLLHWDRWLRWWNLTSELWSWIEWVRFWFHGRSVSRSLFFLRLRRDDVHHGATRTVCQACKGVNGRSCGKCYKMEYPSCSICHSSLHHLAQGSQKGAGFLCLTAPFRPGIIGVRCPLASTLPWAFKAKQCLAQMPFADLASVSLIF